MVVLYQTGNVNFHHCTFTGNEVSAVKAVGSDLTFSGTVMFVNNTASLGAAVILQQKSVMTLAQNSSLLFINNHAISVGGAIYVDTNTFYEVDEEGNAEHITLHAVCSFQFKGETFEFHNNCAGSGGDVVYGGHMGLATTATGSNCLQQFKQFSVINQTNTMSVISSQPSRVCVCNSSGYPDCLTVFYTHTVYPGESISLQAVVVGQDFGTGAGSIYGQFLSSGVEERAKLEQWQYSQEVSQTHCNQLTYSILAAPTRSIVLVLTAVEMGEVQIVSNTTVNSTLKEYHKFQNGVGLFPQELLDFPVYINITVRPCPVGFSLSESSHKCVCNPKLSELSWCVSAYEVTIISNLALYTLAKLYSEGTESFTLDNIFVGVATLQMCCLIIYRLYITSKRQISRIFSTPWKRNHVRRDNVVRKKREANKEETLVKKSSEAMDDGNNEEIPIGTYSLPTYGT